MCWSHKDPLDLKDVDGNTLSDPYSYVPGGGQERVDSVDAPQLFFFIWARTYGIKVFPKTGLYNPRMLAAVEYETMAMVMR